MTSTAKNHHGTVVVALPAKDDPVHLIGNEPKHATVAYLGDDVSDDDLAKVRSAVSDYCAGAGPFPERVKGVESLGDDGARVWMLHSDDGLSSMHEDMVDHPVVGPLMAKAQQFPTYTPHVTIGYPSDSAEGDVPEGEKPRLLPDDTEDAAKGVDSVRFDRLGVWCGPDRTEHPLAAGVAEVQIFPLAEVAKLLEFAGQETPGTAADTERLMAYWAEGEGAAKIGWGTPDDFYRCEAELGKYVGPDVVKGLCSNLHKRATGFRPGRAPSEQESHQEVPMGVPIHEVVALTERSTGGESGRWIVTAISAGQGSSGYYSPEVLEDAGKRQLISAGTKLFFDHASESDRKNRPERSVRDIAAVFKGPATYNPTTRALEGEIQVFKPYRELVSEMGPHIGLSISGSATDVRKDARRTIEGLHSISSVDLVTQAGRGGAFESLLESARDGMDELAHDDPTLVVEAKYDAEQLRKMAANGQAMKNPEGDPSYPIADEADLRNAIHAVGRGSGDHDAIRAHIKKRAAALGCSSLIPDDWSTTSTSESGVDPTHVPAGRPGDTKETHMGMKEIEESEYTRLTETAGRVTTLEAALSKAQGELTEARAALIPNKDLREHLAKVITENAMLRAREVAVPMIAEALEDALIGDAARKRIAGELLNGITLKEADDQGHRNLDTDGLTEAINAKVRVAEAEAQELREAMGLGNLGQPRGLGRVGGGLLIEQKLEEYTDTTGDAIGKAFGLTEAAAKTAGKGRI